MDTQGLEATRGRERAGMTATPAPSELDDATSVFVHVRPGLLKIARRIVGHAGEAEDVIQEAWLRWQGTDRTVVLNPAALLRTTTVRLAVNVVRSAWRRRESCAGPWLPEPADTEATPEAVAERHPHLRDTAPERRECEAAGVTGPEASRCGTQQAACGLRRVSAPRAGLPRGGPVRRTRALGRGPRHRRRPPARPASTTHFRSEDAPVTGAILPHQNRSRAPS